MDVRTTKLFEQARAVMTARARTASTDEVAVLRRAATIVNDLAVLRPDDGVGGCRLCRRPLVAHADECPWERARRWAAGLDRLDD